MTDTDALLLKVTALGTLGVLAYLLMLRRFADLAQSYRLELAEVGERELAKELSPHDEERVRFYLDNAFSGWVMAVAVIALPAIAVYELVARFFKKAPVRLAGNPGDDRLRVLFTVSAFAANPICGAVVAMEFLFFGMLLLLFHGPDVILMALNALMRVEVAARLRRTDGRFQHS